MERIVQTDRLCLRHFLRSDATDCFAFLSDRETCYNDGGYEPFAEMDAEYDLLMQRFASQQSRYMMVERASGKVIGTIHLMEAEEPGVWEIGYVVSPGYRRQGYASEAVRGVCRMLFRELGAVRIIAGTIESNRPSLAMLEKLGFAFWQRQKDAFRHSEQGTVDLLYYWLDAAN